MAKTTSDAVEILRGRYVQGDPERKAAVEAERANAEIARLIYTMRTEARLTQGRLAELVGTTQSVISRLEDSDYEGHSLSMLHRIAEALQKKVTVVMTAKDPFAERGLGGACRASRNQSVVHDEKICHADARLAHQFAAAQSERYARREYLPAVSGRISPCCNRMGKVTQDLAFKSRRPAPVIIPENFGQQKGA